MPSFYYGCGDTSEKPQMALCALLVLCPPQSQAATSSLGNGLTFKIPFPPSTGGSVLFKKQRGASFCEKGPKHCTGTMDTSWAELLHVTSSSKDRMSPNTGCREAMEKVFSPAYVLPRANWLSTVA